MRDVVLKTPTILGAFNAILDCASGVKVKVRNTDPSQKALVRAAKIIISLIRRPNPQEN